MGTKATTQLHLRSCPIPSIIVSNQLIEHVYVEIMIPNYPVH
jgi:hypothetical protein